MFHDASSKQINLSGRSRQVTSDTLMTRQRKTRLEREKLQKREFAQTKISSFWRGFVEREKLSKRLQEGDIRTNSIQFIRGKVDIEFFQKIDFPDSDELNLNQILSSLVRIAPNECLNKLCGSLLSRFDLGIVSRAFSNQSRIEPLIQRLDANYVALLGRRWDWIWKTWEIRSDVFFYNFVFFDIREPNYNWERILLNMLKALKTNFSEKYFIGAGSIANERLDSFSKSVRKDIESKVLPFIFLDPIPKESLYLITNVIDFTQLDENKLLEIALKSKFLETLASENFMDIKQWKAFTYVFQSVISGSLRSYPFMEFLIPKMISVCFEKFRSNTFTSEWFFLVNFLKRIHSKKNELVSLANDTVWEIPESVHTLIDLNAVLDDDEEMIGKSFTENLVLHMPYVIPFRVRVQFLNSALMQTKRNAGSRSVKKIRRNNILEDGLREIFNGTTNLKEMIRIEFVAPDGSVEAGIDGGGLFKEFIHLWLREILSSDIFEQLPNGRVCPNGVRPDFKALGRAVGKAIYETVLLETHFSESFISRVIGGAFSIDQLEEVDEALYKNLLFLENNSVQDLNLYFQIQNTDLIPNGSEIAVTNNNKAQYIILATWFHLGKRLDKSAAAFAKGIEELIPMNWLRMFSPSEINTLISGEQREGFDIDDLKNNTVYGGGYASSSETVEMFWKLLKELPPHDQSAFLSFVTSCPRPPLLGFQTMHPKFAINRVPEPDRLPTASTCVNLLKLPDYKDMKILEKKIQIAIHSQSGFDLS